MRNQLFKKTVVAAILFCLLIPSVSMAAGAADSEKIAQLEKKVAELEKKIKSISDIEALVIELTDEIALLNAKVAGLEKKTGEK